MGSGGSGGAIGGPPIAAGQGGFGGGGMGGQTPIDPEMCSEVSQTAEVVPGPVDIVWAIDTSASMVDEVAAVNANITSFASMIQSAGIDHHVIMLALLDIVAGTPLGDDPAHYRYVPANVDSNNALQVMLDMYPEYASFLRPDASLHFVVVTDDESFVTAADFRAQMDPLAGKAYAFHAVASPDSPGPCIGECGLPVVCGAFAAGIQYYALADATGGQKSSICVADWTEVFGPLQQAVISSAPLPCDYPIPAPPEGETLDAEKVNMKFTAQGAMDVTTFPRADAEGECGDASAWFYDEPSAPTLLRLCPATCALVQAGGTVDIAFGCETVPLVVD